METHPLNLPEELDKRRQIILRELKKRALWFIQLRWFVPPSIIASTAVGYLVGVDFEEVPLLLIAAFMCVYNAVFYLWGRLVERGPGWKTEQIRRFTHSQVVLDYVSMFLLIHFTGGVASPLIFFFIFHVIFASILLPAGSAYFFALLAVVGMALITAAENFGWLHHHAIGFQGNYIDLFEKPFHIIMTLGFFAASVFIAAYSTTTIMPVFRKRMQNLAELSDTVVAINNRLNALYAITKSISSTSRFQAVLDISTSELASVMKVFGTSIKLLSEDGKQLRYASNYGLPSEFTKDKVVEIDKSPLNRRIIEGEPFVVGKLTRQELFQFGEDMAAIGIKSALFVPLMAERRVLGILGAYSKESERFGVDELDFFRLAAGIVAVALENARAFEAIEKLNKERLWFMLRVAHNLRAPLDSNISTINMIRQGYMGEITEEQHKYLLRIIERSQAMIATLNELMILAETRREKRESEHVPVNLGSIVKHIEGTFRQGAVQKGVAFMVNIPENFPEIQGDPEMIEEMFENLVSNSIKYTTPGGRVGIEFSCPAEDKVQIDFTDTGIGIPRDAMPRLFTEFFRAENAREVEEIGTGLGLAIVKDIVIQHRGRITVESEAGQGTTFTVVFPGIRRKDQPIPQPSG
ncbi:MAG: HAMP domain-containing histidine kinase [Candidatus Hydrogenedentota bacterium]|nr:MAG: HAMP domain-containing histidine kinase [Candidatus Hydrogenedentota bacterium]